MERSPFRLSRPLKAAVYLSSLMLVLTGAGWMLAQSRLDTEGWEKIPRLLLGIHGGAAMLYLLILGALSLHVKRGWKAHKNRLSGALLIGLNVFLILTGYGLYYAGGEALREWLSHWHAWMGLGIALLLPAHIIAGRMLRRKKPRHKLVE